MEAYMASHCGNANPEALASLEGSTGMSNASSANHTDSNDRPIASLFHGFFPVRSPPRSRRAVHAGLFRTELGLRAALHRLLEQTQLV
jgi:hypothetical protein